MSFYLPILLQKYATNPLNKNLDFAGFKGVNVAEPSLNQDIATKNYVDITAGGGGASTGSLPFSLVAGATVVGQFTNPTGNDLQLTAPTSTGKLIFSDIHGVDFTNSPTIFSLPVSSTSDVVDITNNGTGYALQTNGTKADVQFNGTLEQNGRIIQNTGGSQDTFSLTHNSGAGDALHITNNGSGRGLNIDNTGIIEAVNINDTGTNVQTINVVKQNNGNGMTIQKASGIGDNIYFERNAGASTGDVIRILKSNTSAGNSLDIDHNGTDPAVYILNRGSSDSFRVDDSASDTGVFRIDSGGSVGINVSPSASIGAVFRVNFASSLFTLDTNNDINLGTLGDIYLGIGGGASNRPRERITFRNEASGAGFGTIYHQYYNASSSNAQRWAWTQPGSNDGCMVVLPFFRSVGIGSIDSGYTPTGVLDVVAPSSNVANPTLRLRPSGNSLGDLLRAENSSTTNIFSIKNNANMVIGGNNNNSSVYNPANLARYSSYVGNEAGIQLTDLNETYSFSIKTDSGTSLDINTSNGTTPRLPLNINTSNVNVDLNNPVTSQCLYTITYPSSQVGAFSVKTELSSEVYMLANGGLTINSTTYTDCPVLGFYNPNTAYAGAPYIAYGAGASTDDILLINAGSGANALYSYSKVDLQCDSGKIRMCNAVNDPTQYLQFETTDLVSTTNTIKSISSGAMTINVSNETNTAQLPLTIKASQINLDDGGTGSIKITNLSNPTNPLDAVNKQYADSLGGGTATAFTLNSNTAGNANGNKIINLSSGTNTGDAVRTEVLTWNTLFGPISSLINLPRPIIGASNIAKLINSNGAIGVNTQNTNNIYYLLSSSASPNTGVQLNTSANSAFNVAPCVPVPTNPTGFSSTTVWSLYFKLTGSYRISFSARVGNLASGTITSSRFNLSLYQGFYNDLLISNPTPDTIITDGALGYYAGSNNPVSSAGALNNFLTFDYIHLYDSSTASNCLTFGTISGAGALDWAGASINTNNLVISVEYLGRIYQ